MDLIVKNSIYGFFTSLEKDSFLIYNDSQRNGFIQDLGNFLRLDAITEIEHKAILLWLGAIRKGDLGDWCASYYYNINERRLSVLRNILDMNF